MFYLLNKKKVISSFKAIREFARENNIKKIGHTGTLDPLATGLLLVATEDDTKLIDFIDKGNKSYIATMKVGYSSDTLDSEGEVTKETEFDNSKVEEVTMSFVKTYDQMPPDFSAKKVNGKRAYQLAREGKEVKLSTSKVTINKIIDFKELDEETFQFEVEVSRGTYIRSLIRDIGQALGTEAIMTDLVRNKLVGLDLSNVGETIEPSRLINLESLKIEDLKTLFLGKPMNIETKDGQYAVEHKKDIIGIVEIKENSMTKRKLFGNKYERILNESS